MATRKSYNQACPVSTALDVIGDRWTFLLIRELLGGPARFSDLMEGLPGIPRNLLATRLKRLEEDGLVRKLEPRGSYALTALGEGARGIVEALGFWGASVSRVGPIEHGRSVRAMAMALNAILRRGIGTLPDEAVTMELAIDGEPVEVVLSASPRASVRLPVAATVTLRTTGAAISGFLDGEGIAAEQLDVVVGPPDAAQTLITALTGQDA